MGMLIGMVVCKIYYTKKRQHKVVGLVGITTKIADDVEMPTTKLNDKANLAGMAEKINRIELWIKRFSGDFSLTADGKLVPVALLPTRPLPQISCIQAELTIDNSMINSTDHMIEVVLSLRDGTGKMPVVVYTKDDKKIIQLADYYQLTHEPVSMKALFKEA